jgi:hypothetical protein
MNIQGNTLVNVVDEPHVVIPEGVEIIGKSAFSDCTSLTSVILPEGLTSIGWGAFYECSGLTSIVFPSTLTSIGGQAFYGCSGLTSVVLPEGFTSIGNYAFWKCSGLTSVELPSSLTSIGGSAFCGCTGLTSVDLSQTNLTSIGGFPWCTGLTSVTFPEGLTSIAVLAFQGCRGLTSVVFPSTLTSIGASAFKRCSGLTSVVFTSTLTSIGARAFKGCSGLTSVVFPSTLSSIGVDAFDGCTNLNVLVPPCQVHPTAFRNCLLVLNASGRFIRDSIDFNPRIIGLRQRLLAIWLQNIRRQGKMRQTSKGYGTNTVASQSFVDLYSADEKVEVVQIWREIKRTLGTYIHFDLGVFLLFRKIIEGGRKLVKMKSYLNQPEETKVFKQVLKDLGIEEPRRFRNWKGRLEPRKLRF